MDKSDSKEIWRIVLLCILIPVVLGTALLSTGVIKPRNLFCWNGISTKNYSNGKIWFKTSYRSGLKHGLEIQYYANGQKKYQKRYKKGKLHGTVVAWTAQGLLAHEDHYANGKPHGTSTEYSASGNIISIDTHNHGIKVKTIQYVIDRNKKRISYQGLYKGNKPWSGQFIRASPKLGYKIYTFEKGKLIHNELLFPKP